MSDYHARVMRIQANRAGYPVDGAYLYGYRDARHSAAEIASEADAQIDELMDALRFFSDRAKQPGENDNAHFERLAAEFERKTGFMAPGKSAPPEMEADRDRTEEWAAWRAFLAEPLEKARAALRNAEAEDELAEEEDRRNQDQIDR